jgi:DNA modification methylase
VKNEIVCSDALEFLKNLPESSVHTCVTSPPYYRLRDYGADGQIGLEDTPEEYIEKLTAVFREVRRVLHPAGTCWLVIGDSYNGSGGAGGDYGPGGMKEGRRKYPGRRLKMLKPKDLIGIPWTLAFALKDNGWWLRQCVKWEKPNVLLEPVTDRPATCHEYIFLFAKSEKYFYDYLAAVEPLGNQRSEGKRLRSVWRIPAEGFSAKKYGLDVEHYAVFPEALAERCIRLSTPEAGVCGKCGAPWVR